jgi:hypothetical protein
MTLYVCVSKWMLKGVDVELGCYSACPLQFKAVLRIRDILVRIRIRLRIRILLKIKSHKTVGINVFLLFLLDDSRIRIRFRTSY